MAAKKKVLEIWVDEGTDLRAFCGTWVVLDKNGASSVTLQNLKIKEEQTVLYLPWKSESKDEVLLTDKQWLEYQAKKAADFQAVRFWHESQQP